MTWACENVSQLFSMRFTEGNMVKRMLNSYNESLFTAGDTGS